MPTRFVNCFGHTYERDPRVIARIGQHDTDVLPRVGNPRQETGRGDRCLEEEEISSHTAKGLFEQLSLCRRNVLSSERLNSLERVLISEFAKEPSVDARLPIRCQTV